MRRGWVWEGEERKTSFLKKRSKRLLSMASNTESKWMELGVTRNRKKFFGSFFKKRIACLPFFSMAALTSAVAAKEKSKEPLRFFVAAAAGF
ncbi:MAG TPA: hypothetical protein VMB71_08825 [Acetobacteraceae bacterium]|nr:hypothetical protein [Acetobacteraceae bacterium]